MRIGLFTDTYFPQVSGVATSIRTLKTELEKLGHTVFIFTTTDKDVNRYEDWQIIRIPSIPSLLLRIGGLLIAALPSFGHCQTIQTGYDPYTDGVFFRTTRGLDC